MTNNRARRRARQWARHANRNETLYAHNISWAATRAMSHPAAFTTYFHVRRQSPLRQKMLANAGQ